MAKERFQSVTLNEEINLDFYSYQNNSLIDVESIQKIEIYFLDPSQVSKTNPQGRRIKQVIQPGSITNIATGHYRTTIALDDSLFEVGNYIDVWYVKFNDYDPKYIKIENQFVVSTDLRETWDKPFVYDITFAFNPKKIMLGSKKYLKIQFYPTIPIEKDILDRFYFNLKTTQNLYIRIEQIEGCGYDSGFREMNIKTEPEWDEVEVRGDNEAYYLLDTTENGEYPLGIYTVQFKILLDGQEILSPKFYLQVLD